MNWNEYFFSMCDTIASKSKDPSSKFGCVIVDKDNFVLSIGYNGFPSGVIDDEKRYKDRKIKYLFVAHAEANAICFAARHGISLKGAILYVQQHPCNECAKLIIQAGISAVVIHPIAEDYKSRWRISYEVASKMFEESGVRVIYV